MTENVLLLGLDQIVALLSNVLQEAKHVETAGRLDLFQHGINDYVRASSTHAGAAVHNDGAAVFRRVGLGGFLDEGEHGKGVSRDPVVRP